MTSNIVTPSAAPASTVETVEVTTLADLLVRACVGFADRPALVVGDDRRSYAELLAGACGIARALVAAGVEPGERVGLFLPNGVLFVEGLYGVTMAGAVCVPINTRFRTRELSHVIRDSQLKLVLTATASGGEVRHPQRLAEATSELPADVRPRVVEWGPARQPGHHAGDEFVAAGEQVSTDVVAARRRTVRVRDTAAILYTSGTTATPKGCIHSHEALVRNGRTAGRTRFLLSEHDRFWDPLPMFHVGFLAPCIACVDAGALMIAMPHFDARAGMDLIRAEAATWLYPAFHALATDMVAEPGFGASVPHVRMMMCTGNETDLRAFQRAIPHAQLLSCYGSTETGGIITYHEPNASHEDRARTCGTPFAGIEVRIATDSTGSPDQGEILVRGFSVLDGYLNVAAGDSTGPVDGWLHTGDLGRLTPDGQLVYLGRIKDMLKVGGENVAPSEVETVLAEHPAVKAVQVVGAPDPRLDEVVAAFVEKRPQMEVTAEELVAYCVARIASYKVPRYIRFVDDWPMSATKVDKRQLRERLAAEGRHGGSGQC